ncbi:MAG: hypothetical protein OXG04_30015 [Acidobacteria bacterium]|nr:hypothetical protein [Acidobacteriota bacterium]
MTVRIDQPAGPMRMGKVTRRDLLVAGIAAAIARPAAALAGPLAGRPPAVPVGGAAAARSALPIRVSTLNHVSFGCADLRSTVEWYEKVLAIPRHGDSGPNRSLIPVQTDH